MTKLQACIPTFESYAKDMDRVHLAHLYHSSPVKEPILLLDDGSAGGTLHLLRQQVPGEHILPVNRCRDACESISKLSGIPCECSELDVALSNSSRRFVAVWMDLMCRTVTEDSLRAALNVTDHILLTLSTRGTSPSQLRDTVRVAVKRAGGYLQADTLYRGSGGVLNMLRFFITRHKKKETMKTKKTHIPKKKKVHAANSCAKMLIGKKVGLPVSLWTQGRPHGYEFAQKEGGCIHFMIASTHYRNKLALKTILKGGKVHPNKEKWTLTVEDALRYAL